MPICPKCRVEYREGFAECADCGVELVESLPKEDTEIEKEPVKSIDTDLVDEAFLCEAQNPIEASIIESILDEYNIPHRSSAGAIAGLQILTSPTLSMEIYVPETALEQAREAIAKATEDVDTEWYDDYYDSPEAEAEVDSNEEDSVE